MMTITITYFLSQGAGSLNCGSTKPRYDTARRGWLTATHGVISDFTGTEYTLSSEEVSDDPESVSSPYTPEEIATIRSNLRATLRQKVLDEAKLKPAAIIDSLVCLADTPEDSLDEPVYKALRRWRTALWVLGYQVEAEIIAGDRAVPTPSELLALMPLLADFEDSILEGGGP